MNHLDVEKDEFGGTTSKAKTIGKMLDNYLTFEGLFTIVLYATINVSNKTLPYGFETKNDGTTTVKTPKGMFDEARIPNDLYYVVDKINEYYS